MNLGSFGILILFKLYKRTENFNNNKNSSGVRVVNLGILEISLNFKPGFLKHLLTRKCINSIHHFYMLIHFKLCFYVK